MTATSPFPIRPATAKCVLMAVPLAISAVIVFWDIQGVGLSHWDEYNYLVTAKWFLRRPDGAFTIYEPPGFPFAVSLFFRIFGVKDYIAIAVSGIFAIATVALVTYFALRSFAAEVAMIAPIMLIISPLFLTYARMALTDMAFTFVFSFALVAMYRALRSRRLRDGALAGLALGACVMTKYNGFMPLVVFVCYLLIISKGIKAGDRLGTALGWIKLVFLMCIPSVLFGLLFFAMLGISTELPASQVFSLHAFKIISLNLPNVLGRGFAKFNSAAIHYHAGQLGFFPLTSISYYSQTLGTFVPLPVLLLSIVGLLRRDVRDSPELFVALWLLLTFFLISSTPTHYTRAILPVLPPIALSAGLGLSRLKSLILSRNRILHKMVKFRVKSVVGPILLVLVIALSLQGALESISMEHRGYRQAGQFLNSIVGNSQVLAQTQPVIAFYYPVTLGEMNSSSLLRNQFLIIDFIAAENGYLPQVQQLKEQGRIKLLATIHNDLPEEVYLDSMGFEQLPRWNYTYIQIYEIVNGTTTQVP